MILLSFLMMGDEHGLLINIWHLLLPVIKIPVNTYDTAKMGTVCTGMAFQHLYLYLSSPPPGYHRLTCTCALPYQQQTWHNKNALATTTSTTQLTQVHPVPVPSMAQPAISHILIPMPTPGSPLCYQIGCTLDPT